ncbi:long-chain-fatty-acid--CoA ligase [mine drainage metagenome]|uniref:Long-chain-fatty-acid--CoA ligase n=1 Tax=mine drainage metagenome TaxID=410659 RepID=A0A1J5SGV7_9ZZZZ
MESTNFLDQLISRSADRTPERIALSSGEISLDYAELASSVSAFASGIGQLGVGRQERIGIYLEKRPETVIATFGASAAGAVFVPLNPLLKPEQVGYILKDCNVRLLLTSPERLALLGGVLPSCHDLRHLVVTGGGEAENDSTNPSAHPALTTTTWDDLLAAPPRPGHRIIDTDMAAILYTSGSTGQAKGVVLSQRNMVMGAKSVASYLGNNAQDTLLAALPLSFDAGFSQLTTAFHAGARAVLLNYLLPRDVLKAVIREGVTGLTAVPPLWIQLSQLQWPEAVGDHLRYLANTGGRLPLATLTTLREQLPRARVFLMYGLTEAFRSTYLPPAELERRPDSIGKAIPNAEILVLREDGTPCAANEPGELVHRGALVGMGYWNDPEKTAERYKPLPGREAGLVLPEIAVFSGDTVRMDEEGFLYFIGRRDDMIKSSGYRISPTEIEEVCYGSQLVGEAAAFGVPHEGLGQAVMVVATPKVNTRIDVDADAEALFAVCRERLPAYMQPARIDFRPGPLPRNANGKIDRKSLAKQFETAFTSPRPR